MRLAARMWKAKMLRGIPAARAYSGMFAVIKKVSPTGNHDPRLIFDLRQGEPVMEEHTLGYRWAVPPR